MTDKGFDEDYDPAYGGDFAPAEEDYPEEGTRSGEGVHWPTVLAAAGASLLVAALITTLGVVWALRSGDSEDKDATIAMYEQLLAADAKPVSSGSGSTTAADHGTRSGESRTAGRAGSGATRSGDAGRAGSGATLDGVDAAEDPDAVDDGGDAGYVDDGGSADDGANQALAPDWGPVEVDDNMHLLMNQGTADATIAEYLEAGAGGVPTVRDIQARFEAAKLFYSWELDYDSVYIDGDALYADLTLTLSGMGTKPFPIYYLDIDAGWRLSNESLCDLAEQARVECRT
ncbi:hypothetical protein CSPHI_01650 [Corynebacterium sphenisci DSM 44792]|uniref:Low molecular weight antigen MTB12-like C-terminal domain-containing protein n=1 Tax=Corynebacterium sphenisci DSM 44792 TaxID=1437874 RepID=A0A1L7CW14_9CORY|nr:hypothetical protein [Corynebacterium sphenisci]APT90000.1 hypothetical protein CSPHI_01650 [Corynebacterium sphenisci DSM 44792]